MKEQTKIKCCGWAGITGATMLLASDWLMMGTFVGAREFQSNWLAILAKMPDWRLTMGALTGPFAAWLYVVGFWQLYVALRPAGKRLAFACWACCSIGFIYAAGAFHTSFPFMAHVARSMGAAETDVQAIVLNDSTIQYALTLFAVGSLPSLAGYLILGYAVLMLPTRYPRWAVIFNPLVLYALTLTFRFIPAPVGALLYIGYGNIIFLLFFIASTVVLTRNDRALEAGD